MTAPVFISGTGTEIGKTYVTCLLVEALRSSGMNVAAIKPIETGCDPIAEDAVLLAAASEDPSLADNPCFYRAKQPLAPAAIELQGLQTDIDLGTIARAVYERADSCDLCVVEGAGGLFVPLNAKGLETTADLARILNARIVIVAQNRLGVLSDTLAIVEAARARQLHIEAIFLNNMPGALDQSAATNKDVLQRFAGTIPVVDNVAALAKTLTKT